MISLGSAVKVDGLDLNLTDSAGIDGLPIVLRHLLPVVRRDILLLRGRLRGDSDAPDRGCTVDSTSGMRNSPNDRFTTSSLLQDDRQAAANHERSGVRSGAALDGVLIELTPASCTDAGLSTLERLRRAMITDPRTPGRGCSETTKSLSLQQGQHLPPKRH